MIRSKASKDSSRGFQISFEISFLISVRKTLSTSGQIVDVTLIIFFVWELNGPLAGESDLDYAVVLEVRVGVHVLLEVEVEVLEDEVYALVVVLDVVQPAHAARQDQQAAGSIYRPSKHIRRTQPIARGSSGRLETGRSSSSSRRRRGGAVT